MKTIGSILSKPIPKNKDSYHKVVCEYKADVDRYRQDLADQRKARLNAAMASGYINPEKAMFSKQKLPWYKKLFC